MRELITATLISAALSACSGDGGAGAGIYEAEQVVKAGLRDPKSAQFSNVRHYVKSAPNPAVVCGYVNARNGFGGYVGDRRFVVTIGTGIPIIDEAPNGENEVFNRIWDESCR